MPVVAVLVARALALAPVDQLVRGRDAQRVRLVVLAEVQRAPHGRPALLVGVEHRADVLVNRGESANYIYRQLCQMV